MIIVSQDRDSIVNFDKVHNLWIEDNNNHKFYETEENDEYDYEILADDETLGYYKTEARAKEVMEEITQKYEFAMRYLGKNYMSFDKYDYVYEMPKK